MTDERDRELDDVVATLRSLDVDDRTFVQPPVEIWDAIAEEIGDEGPPHRATPPAPATTTVSTTVEGAGSVVSMNARRHQRPRHSFLLAAAAVVVIAVGVASYALTRSDDPQIVATADLTYDAAAYDALGEGAQATVDLVADGDAYAIEFERAALPSSQLDDADLELWLLRVDDNGDVVDLVSLGLVDSIDHPYAVPAGFDPDDYRVVDISVEPRDGDEQHSGRTILRGPLSA
jgi:anti-sigma-K factor RskA